VGCRQDPQDCPDRDHAYFVIERGDGYRAWVFPDLLFRAWRFTLGRTRDSRTFAALRARCDDWSGRHLGPVWAYPAVISSVELAMESSTLEDGLRLLLRRQGSSSPEWWERD